MRIQKDVFPLMWKIVLTLSTTLAVLIIPLRIMLGYQSDSILLSLEWTITFIFIVDIIINFNYAAWKISRYGKWWLAVDILSAIPFSFIVGASLIQLLRLLKLARIAQFLKQWRQHQVQHLSIIRLIIFVYGMALSVHWLACGWLLLRGGNVYPHDWSDYIRAFYWCVTTIATVGYGDITPKTNAEMIYAMCVMIVGAGAYGYVIGNVASILTKIDPVKAHYIENMERLSAFMHYRNIPNNLRQKIREYYAYMWDKRRGYDESTVLAGLPPNLMMEVSLFLKKDIIEKVPFFQGASEELIRDLALQMRSVVYTPGDYVFKEGEPGHDMFFISRGTVEVIGKDGHTVLAVLREGDFFGEMALLLGQPRNASIRAVDYCDLYALDKTTIERVISRHPDFGTHIQTITQERLKNK